GVAFDSHTLDVAGPPIAFNGDAAVGAALVMAGACWSLAAGSELELGSLDVGVKPLSPSTHLSGDVTLRLLPMVYPRAVLRDPEGRLAKGLKRLLRRWPLSGVLAELDRAPATPPEFDGHPGLHLLYTERLGATWRGHRRAGRSCCCFAGRTGSWCAK